MVQLNTTYDSKIKEKIFILKGDEGYARTTDVIANLITSFSDYDTKLEHCHVGLEIQVLREFGGDSHIHIYINGEVKSIPWDSEHMDEIIDASWNNQGIYWENGKLIFGKYETTPSLIEKGLYLPYDVEHTIKVRYDGNTYCLGSSAKPLVFTVPTPDKFRSMLTLSGETRFAPDSSVNISLRFDCEASIQEAKTVLIYDGDDLIATVDDVEKGVISTVNLGVLSDGLHNLVAVFEGDDEAMASKSSIQYISVGYNISQVQYTPALITGTTGTLSCVVTDYFVEPWDDLSVKVSEYNGSTWNDISSSATTDENGAVSFNTVQYNANPFAVTIGNWHSRTYTTQIIYPSDISIQSSRELLHTQLSDSTFISGYLMNNDEPLVAEGIHLVAKIYDRTGEIPNPIVKHIYTQSNGKYSFEFDGKILNSRKSGIKRIVVMLYNDQQMMNSIDIPLVEYDWNKGRLSQYGRPNINGASVSRTNEGFKLSPTSTDTSIVSYMYDPNVSPSKIMEFDYIDGALEKNDRIMGISINGLSSPLIKGSRIKAIQFYDKDNHTYFTKIYQNDTQIAIFTSQTQLNAFPFEFKNISSYIIIDNIRMYGGAEQ